ncbi:LacI family transcriptional regulator [Eubacteriales bacterium OttesenSCG-928-A19]|nr:LacI family transcriptional regulator [Eubacteriales bacterium OttesenSCG-928-A19]
MKTVRIKDVAARAQVSVATITRVVNGSGYVSEATRERVQRAIDELGYIPNRMASALKSKQTGIIGNILPSIEVNPFFTSLTAAIGRHAGQYGYQIMSMVTSFDKDVEGSLIDDLIGRMAEGIFFIGETLTAPAKIEQLVRGGIPVVMLERPLALPGIDKVTVNAFEGSAFAAARFARAGHHDVAYIGVRLRHTIESDRYEGFRVTLQAHGVRLTPARTVFVDEYTTQHGYDAMRALLDGPGPHPTAVFVASDILACGALQCLYDARLRVPDDVSVIGYDNTLAASATPAISSVAMPVEDIAKAAMDLFREQKAGERQVGKSVALSPFYVDRGTVREG